MPGDPSAFLQQLSLLQSPSPIQVSPDQLIAPYLVYKVRTYYHWDNGTLQLPVAYTTPTTQTTGQQVAYTAPYTQRQAASVVQVTAPHGLKVVTFEIARLGAKPTLPDPTPQSSNEVLGVMDVQPEAPTLGSDGRTYIYKVSGVYLYRLLQPYWHTDGLFTGGKTAADQATKTGNALTTKQYSSTIA